MKWCMVVVLICEKEKKLLIYTIFPQIVQPASLTCFPIVTKPVYSIYWHKINKHTDFFSRFIFRSMPPSVIVTIEFLRLTQYFNSYLSKVRIWDAFSPDIFRPGASLIYNRYQRARLYQTFHILKIKIQFSSKVYEK
jgi:hypothetical protein